MKKHNFDIFTLFLISELCCSMYCLCVNVYYCHRVSSQLQLNISYHISFKSYPGQQQSSAIVWSLLLQVGIQPEVPLIASAPLLSIAFKINTANVKTMCILLLNYNNQLTNQPTKQPTKLSNQPTNQTINQPTT